MPIGYNGKPEFSRPRSLTETETLETFQNKLLENSFSQNDERDEATDKLFNGLAKTYLKGNSLLKGLSKMSPAQFIPIEEEADSTRAAATRIDAEESNKGSIITYSLYQKAINTILDKKKELKGTYLNIKLPASLEQQSKETTTTIGSNKGLLSEFMRDNGIAATIIGMLTLAPFQTVIFQTLGVEETAKGVQTAQIPAGIALFLELGIKADRILTILKNAKVSTPLVELQIAKLSKSESDRAAALTDAGIDYTEFKKSQAIQDCQNIVNYVSEYYTRYGGLDGPNGHLTIDHWVAYLHVAQNQRIIEGALNSSYVFSPKFRSIKEQYSVLPGHQENIYKDKKDHSKLLVQLASAARYMKESSDSIYDDIINSFNYQLTDADLCCLVQIFGELGNPDLMYTIASLLRILATSLSGEILRIQNLMSRFLANIMQDALFEVATQINQFYYKVVNKITKIFTVDLENLTSCPGMFTLGWALMHTVRVLFDEVSAMIKELSSVIGDFGTTKSGSWKIAADRRYLLGTARILEVLAGRLSLANQCKLVPKTTVSKQISDSNSNIDQALFSILGSRHPTLEISETDRKKFFSNLKEEQSTNLKFNYGISPEQNNENASTSKCVDEPSKEKIEALIKNLTTAIDEAFNG